MRVVIISGSHPRHKYFVEKIAETGLLKGVVIQKRENMVFEPPIGLKYELKKLFIHHFQLRDDMEKKYFGSIDMMHLKKNVPFIEVDEADLNGHLVESFIKEVRADMIISYGPGLIHENILKLVNGYAFNLHGGLSPWYKGSATMFWPFYFLEPNYVGTTFHYITSRIDAGGIVHQSVPQLQYGDCMHEVSCKAIVKASEDVFKLLSKLQTGEILTGHPQKRNGKLFLDRDWRPEHLKLIYEVYNDNIVDLFLDGEINIDNNPQLIDALKN